MLLGNVALATLVKVRAIAPPMDPPAPWTMSSYSQATFWSPCCPHSLCTSECMVGSAAGREERRKIGMTNVTRRPDA